MTPKRESMEPDSAQTLISNMVRRANHTLSDAHFRFGSIVHNLQFSTRSIGNPARVPGEPVCHWTESRTLSNEMVNRANHKLQ